jgi:hypothetical protein
MEALQNFTEYEPTDKEQNLLEVLINPENRMKSVTDICKLAKCTRPVYYEAFQKPGFTTLYQRMSMDIVKQSIAPVLNAFVREAQRGSFQHGKALLEMAGIYDDEKKARIAVLKAKAQNGDAGEVENLTPLAEMLKDD